MLRRLVGALLNLFLATPEGFEYFPYSFKAWKSPSNPYKQEGFSHLCVWYHYVLWIVRGLFVLCYVLLELTNNPGVTNSCGCSCQRQRHKQEGTCRHMDDPAEMCSVLPVRSPPSAAGSVVTGLVPACLHQAAAGQSQGHCGPQQSKQRTSEMSFPSTLNTEGRTSSLCCRPQWKKALIFARLPS